MIYIFSIVCLEVFNIDDILSGYCLFDAENVTLFYSVYQ